MTFTDKLIGFIKKEIVLCISFAAALVSCFFVKPGPEYIGYIDFRTLALLFCLMTVVAGFKKSGLFDLIARKMCDRAKGITGLCMGLVLLCFFCSMLITNDVALITFVPFAVLVLNLAGGSGSLLIKVVILQTLAANLGSMLTPVGNPQNLYIYSWFNIPFGDFIKITAPLWILSLVVCAVLVLAFCKDRDSAGLGQRAAGPSGADPKNCSSEDPQNSGTQSAAALENPPKEEIEDDVLGPAQNFKTQVIFYGILFAVCLATVLRILNWQVMLVIVLLSVFTRDRQLLRDADYMLLLTFVCFFVFSGNLARIPQISEFLSAAMAGRTFEVSAMASQVISNVPAAVLLSGFTADANALLLGVDAGGLGTPIASLASLISYKLYCAAEGAQPARYMKLFLLINFAVLAVLWVFCKAVML